MKTIHFPAVSIFRNKLIQLLITANMNKSQGETVVAATRIWYELGNSFSQSPINDEVISSKTVRINNIGNYNHQHSRKNLCKITCTEEDWWCIILVVANCLNDNHL